MKILVSWSSGKDSAWMLHLLRQQHPGAVASLAVSPNRTAMVQVAQRLEPLGDDLAAGNSGQGRDKGNAT